MICKGLVPWSTDTQVTPVVSHVLMLQGFEDQKTHRATLPYGAPEQQAADMALQEFCRLHNTTADKCAHAKPCFC